MPRFVDPIYMKTGTTDILMGSSTGALYHQGVVLPNSTLISPLANVTWPSTVALTLVDTSTPQVLSNKAVTLTTESTATNLSAYGVSVLQTWSTAQAVQYTLNAPVTGCKKTIILNTTYLPDSTAIHTFVYSGSTAIFFYDGSTALKTQQKIGFEPPNSAVELVGLSTAAWMIVNSVGLVGATS